MHWIKELKMETFFRKCGVSMFSHKSKLEMFGSYYRESDKSYFEFKKWKQSFCVKYALQVCSHVSKNKSQIRQWIDVRKMEKDMVTTRVL